MYRLCVCRSWSHNLDNLLCLRPVVLFTKDFACSSYRTLTKKSNKIRVDHQSKLALLCIVSLNVQYPLILHTKLSSSLQVFFLFCLEMIHILGYLFIKSFIIKIIINTLTVDLYLFIFDNFAVLLSCVF